MVVEKQSEISFECINRVGVPLVITTRERVRIECIELLGDIQLCEPLYFVSFNIDDKKLIPVRGKNMSWGLCTQKTQYHYIKHILMTSPLSDFMHWAIIIFEQTKKGCIHFHIIYKSDEHIQNVKAYLCQMFLVKKTKEAYNTCDIRVIDNLQGVYDYLFNKTKHSYENVDMDIFRPMYLKKPIE